MGNVRMRAEQINYGASNVKVALDDLDPKDLIALSARMDTIEAWKATVKAEEKSGASVEYTNALALAAVSLSAEIVASQDLHGYDHPWVGGAGKNKAELSAGNNTVIAHDLPAGTYTFSCKNTGNVGINLKANTQEGDTLAYTPSATTADITLTFTTTETMDIFVNGYGSGYDSAVSQYQIESGSSATSYAPYSNICPISGRTSVTITQEGVSA